MVKATVACGKLLIFCGKPWKNPVENHTVSGENCNKYKYCGENETNFSTSFPQLVIANETCIATKKGVNMCFYARIDKSAIAV
jgi:hypothetical protein